ncbi:MAG: SPOR domain-containing protein [Chlorobi bacterium]|nr:SPOR domain-containing protein [Chlorobiota bacterium]
MNKLIIILFTGLILLSINACNKEKKKSEKKPVKKTVVHKPVKDSARIADSLARVAAEQKAREEQAAAEAEAAAKAAQKYFLIAGSFQSMENAEKFQKELQQQGYDSEVIVRQTGPNTDFYKVSYKGFADRDEAFKALKRAKDEINNEDVWLLVKK